jgi:hypothetical protein
VQWHHKWILPLVYKNSEFIDRIIPPSADSIASNHILMTRFIDYCPLMFRKMREMRNIDTATYLRSIGPEQLIGNMILGNLSSLSEMSSEGKSGAFFYYTADGNFMIKTISLPEKTLLKRLLKSYWTHLRKHPDSMIIRFFGLHSLHIKKKNLFGKIKDQRIYFVVMGNMFNTPFEIHRRYDLKGSTLGRYTKEADREVGSNIMCNSTQIWNYTINSKFIPDCYANSRWKQIPFFLKRVCDTCISKWISTQNENLLPQDKSRAQKDLDWLGNKEAKIPLGESGYAQAMAQLEADVKFLAEAKIIDYSLLVGIHDVRADEVFYWELFREQFRNSIIKRGDRKFELKFAKSK